MGQDKAFLRLEPDGPMLLEIVLDRLRGVADDVLIVANDTRRHEGFGARVVPAPQGDRLKEQRHSAFSPLIRRCKAHASRGRCSGPSPAGKKILGSLYLTPLTNPDLVHTIL